MIPQSAGSPNGHSPGFPGCPGSPGLEATAPILISNDVAVFPEASVALTVTVPLVTAVNKPCSDTVATAGLEDSNFTAPEAFFIAICKVPCSAIVAAAGTIQAFLDNNVSTAAKASTRQLHAVSI